MGSPRKKGVFCASCLILPSVQEPNEIPRSMRLMIGGPQPRVFLLSRICTDGAEIFYCEDSLLGAFFHETYEIPQLHFGEFFWGVPLVRLPNGFHGPAFLLR